MKESSTRFEMDAVTFYTQAINILLSSAAHRSEAHLRQNKWIAHAYWRRRLETGFSIYSDKQENKTDSCYWLLIFFGSGRWRRNARRSTTIADTNAFRFVWKIYPIPAAGHETNSFSNPKTTYEYHKDTNVSKSGRGGGTQSLAG